MSTQTTVECPRCNGEGFIRAFSHVAGGRCFLCFGAKVIDVRQIANVKEDYFTLGYAAAGTYLSADDRPGEIVIQPERMWVHGQGKNGTVWTFSRDLTDANRAELRAIWAAFAKLPHEVITFDANHKQTRKPVAA